MAGVYLSYPFCEQKCSFCNFASNVGRPGERDRYRTGLLGEVRAHEWEWNPETVYFGGGTPSLMPDGLLAELMAAIPPNKLSEVTIECAPGTITQEAARLWRRAGVNRVSMGVQSFLPKELRLTGRRHTVQTVAADVELLRNEAMANINLDLIAGLPEQTADSWNRSLDELERIAPAHASIYIFECDEDSRLGQEVTLGGVRYGAMNMPTDDQIAELYETAVVRLARMGLQRYEISNFAKPGFESRHNLKYWQLEPYVGFGLDAHSYDGHSRWGNSDVLEEYLTEKPGARVPSDFSEEHFFVGLRLMKGIEPTEAERLRFAKPIQRWLQAGMLEREGSFLHLSSAGVLLSNEIFQEFVNVN